VPKVCIAINALPMGPFPTVREGNRKHPRLIFVLGMESLFPSLSFLPPLPRRTFVSSSIGKKGIIGRMKPLNVRVFLDRSIMLIQLYFPNRAHFASAMITLGEWCMMYDYDGYPGTGLCWIGDEQVDCIKEEVYMAKCIEEPRQWFTFVDVAVVSKNLDPGKREVLIRTADGRCFERDQRKVYLERCDASNALQRWFALNGDLDGEKFELSQVDFTHQCVTNDHHPKSGEVVETHDCESSRSKEDQTSYWERY